MARNGITKAQVRTIREQLLAAGRYPSVEAVRHALGDTGSKSTIHKYLKELGEEPATSRPQRKDTEGALQALVAQLADRLHADAEQRLRLLRAELEASERAKDQELAELRQTVARLSARVRQLEAEAADAGPAEPGDDMPRGFGHFGALVANSRSGNDISPFHMVQTAGRSEIVDVERDWPSGLMTH